MNWEFLMVDCSMRLFLVVLFVLVSFFFVLIFLGILVEVYVYGI